MNRTSILIAATALFLVASARAETLMILHTNDFHSRIEPINRYDGSCSARDNAAGECLGGAARLATAIRVARAKAPNALLVDGGDQFQGSLFYNWYKGNATAEIMNVLGYDAMTVGNHEFDDGPEVLCGFMDAVGFPVLMSNADVSAEPTLAGSLMPSTVIERGGGDAYVIFSEKGMGGSPWNNFPTLFFDRESSRVNCGSWPDSCGIF